MNKSRLEKMLKKESISTLLGILRISDEEAYNHATSVAEIVQEYLCIAEDVGELEWTEEECDEIICGALLHDIGKAFLPFGLQYSSSTLNDDEMEVIKTHPILGVVAVKNCGFGEIIHNIILMHHANANGTGYPSVNLCIFDEDNVPSYVWLVSYADRFDAMTNNRNFKRTKTYPEAWKEILEMSRVEILPYKYARIFGELVKKRSILSIDITEGMS